MNPVAEGLRECGRQSVSTDFEAVSQAFRMPGATDARSQMSNQNQSGITLVQGALLFLLVAIIAVIVFPLLVGHHGDYARRGTCQSNEKQLGMALQQYCLDYDGYFPIGTQKSVVGGKLQSAGVGWGGAVYGYAKSTGLFSCPQDHTPTEDQHHVIISYGLNANFMRNHVSQAAITSPSNTVLLFEVANAHATIEDYDEGAAHGATEFSPAGDGTTALLDDGSKPPHVIYATGGGGERPPLSGIWPPNRHLHNANYLLADGHVKWFKPDQVSTGTNAVGAKSAQTGVVSGHAAGTANGAYAVTFSTK